MHTETVSTKGSTKFGAIAVKINGATRWIRTYGDGSTPMTPNWDESIIDEEIEKEKLFKELIGDFGEEDEPNKI